MDTKADLTKNSIIECARREFLAVGFREASLRKIATAAQVTTGAIYRYFPDKKALFSATTENASTMLTKRHSAMIDEAMGKAEQGISYNQEESQSDIAELYNLIYEHFDEFYLLLMCVDGSDTASFLHSLVELEEKSTLAYFEELRKHHQSDYQIDTMALHFLIEAYISALFEPVRHRIDRESAIRHVQALSEYFSIGWLGVEAKLKNAGKS